MTTGTAPEKRRTTDAPWQKRLNQVLEELWISEEGERKAAHRTPSTLARWRRGLGHTPESSPVIVPEIARVAGPTEPGEFPPGRAVENAVHHALTLFAAHQQSTSQPMHVRSRSAGVGDACRNLCILVARRAAEGDGQKPEEPQFAAVNRGLVRRLEAAMTALSVTELVGHLRGLVPLLRKESIPLDYVRLAADIADWGIPRNRGKVARRWGLDFYTPVRTDVSTPSTSDNNEE